MSGNGGAARQPYFISAKRGRPMVFAGLWERWTVREGIALRGSLAGFGPGGVIETCTILTTAANEALAPIHRRMPVILPTEAFALWLGGETLPLDPYPSERMTVHPVSTLVNNPANDDPRCVAPMAGPQPFQHRLWAS